MKDKIIKNLNNAIIYPKGEKNKRSGIYISKICVRELKVKSFVRESNRIMN
jgi:hypothetical protein